MNASIAAAIAQDGFAVVPDVFGVEHIAKLIAVVTEADFARSARGGDVYGARNILAVPQIAALARSETVLSFARAVIGFDCRAVRGIFFDKTPSANWPVAWHQDLTLAVAERHEVAGWTNWSTKAGVHHVQPPAEILEPMVTLRIQLDDCGAGNGPLKVLPGTHRLGRIAADRLASLRAGTSEHVCIAPAGSALVFKPLLLHASSAATAPSHRRVIHLEYAPPDLLPPELDWAFGSDNRMKVNLSAG